MASVCLRMVILSEHMRFADPKVKIFSGQMAIFQGPAISDLFGGFHKWGVPQMDGG